MRLRSLIIPLSALAAAAAARAETLGGLDTTAAKAGIKGSSVDVATSLASIVALALSFVGVLFLILLIWGGTLWMTAAGNEENIKKARGVVVAAVIGLLIVLSAYAITQFFGSTFGA